MVKPATPTIGPLHHFKTEEVATLQHGLLAWYDANKRVLPWRSIAATESDLQKRVYAGKNLCHGFYMTQYLKGLTHGDASR